MLEFKMTKPRETFLFNSLIQVEGDWMIGIISLEVYNSLFNINSRNNKFDFLTDNFDEFAFEELKDELEEILNISDKTPYHLQHEKIGPCVFET